MSVHEPLNHVIYTSLKITFELAKTQLAYLTRRAHWNANLRIANNPQSNKLQVRALQTFTSCRLTIPLTKRPGIEAHCIVYLVAYQVTDCVTGNTRIT